MYATFLGLILAGALLTGTPAETGAVFTPEYARLSPAEILALDCSSAGEGIDRYVAECYLSQWEVSQREVAEAYALASAKANGDIRTRLARAQEAWERYAQATCALWDNQEGTWPAMVATRCWAQVTRARANELRSLEAID